MSPMQRLAGSFWAMAATITAISVAAIAVSVAAFGLTVGGGTALYFVIWWTLLFVTLPVGVRSQAEAGEIAHGTEPGAPSVPNLRLKSLWTTVLSAIVLVFSAWVMPLAGL